MADRYESPEYREMYRYFKAKYRRRNRLTVHMAAWFIVNTVMWTLWFAIMGDVSADGVDIPWPAWVTLIWMFVVLVHIANVGIREFIESIPFRRRLRRVVEALTDDDETYPSRQMRLTDDGELIEIIADWEAEEKLKRN